MKVDLDHWDFVNKWNFIILDEDGRITIKLYLIESVNLVLVETDFINLSMTKTGIIFCNQ